MTNKKSSDIMLRLNKEPKSIQLSVLKPSILDDFKLYYEELNVKKNIKPDGKIMKFYDQIELICVRLGKVGVIFLQGYTRATLYWVAFYLYFFIVPHFKIAHLSNFRVLR